MAAAAQPPRILMDQVEVVLPGPDGTVIDILRGITLEIEPSEFVCLLGPSGCGKTTLLNCLAGFVTPTAGKITIGGRPVAGTPAEIGIVFQEHAQRARLTPPPPGRRLAALARGRPWTPRD
ncbi:MAG: ATP-binding cassette domain-containing protein [Candidatus Rokuibacteriota bacterium]